MQVEHASLAQVTRGKDGRRVVIEEDVGNIAKRLKEIDERLVLRYSELGEYFQVIEVCPDGSESLVTTAKELTPLLVAEIERLGSEGYKLAAEADRLDREAERQKDYAFEQKVGAVGERLAHAVRRDIQAKHRIFLPRGIS